MLYNDLRCEREQSHRICPNTDYNTIYHILPGVPYTQTLNYKQPHPQRTIEIKQQETTSAIQNRTFDHKQPQPQSIIELLTISIHNNHNYNLTQLRGLEGPLGL